MDCDCVGLGGGWRSASGESVDIIERSVEPEVLSGAKSGLLVLDMLDLPLLPDLMEVVSPLSFEVSFASDEDLGLSAPRELPGIFDRNDLNDLELSFVSDLLKDG